MTDRPASESLTTAISANESGAKTDAPAKADVLKIAEVREDGTAVVEMPDGRMFTASVKDGLEGVKRGAEVTIKSDKLDKHDVPVDAEVVKVKS